MAGRVCRERFRLRRQSAEGPAGAVRVRPRPARPRRGGRSHHPRRHLPDGRGPGGRRLADDRLPVRAGPRERRPGGGRRGERRGRVGRRPAGRGRRHLRVVHGLRVLPGRPPARLPGKSCTPGWAATGVGSAPTSGPATGGGPFPSRTPSPASTPARSWAPAPWCSPRSSATASGPQIEWRWSASAASATWPIQFLAKWGCEVTAISSTHEKGRVGPPVRGEPLSSPPAGPTS